MTNFQSSRNFGFDTDMEMDFTEHSQKRGKYYAIKVHLGATENRKEKCY